MKNSALYGPCQELETLLTPFPNRLKHGKGSQTTRPEWRQTMNVKEFKAMALKHTERFAIGLHVETEDIA